MNVQNRSLQLRPPTGWRAPSSPATCPASATASRPRRCPAPCRSAATRRRNAPTASMPSSSPARPSRRRAPPTSAPGSTASGPPCQHWGQFRKADIGLWRTAPAREVDVPIAPMRWEPDPDPRRAAVLPRGRAHHHDGRRRRQPGRHGRACLPRSPARWSTSTSTMPTARLLFVPQQGDLRLVDRVRHHRHRAGRDRRHPARREDPRRAARRAGARLSLRELRRRLHPAGARADRRQLPRQPARLPHAGRGLRGHGRALEDVREVGRHALGRPTSTTRRSTSSPGTATTRPTSTTCAATRRSGRSCTTMPTRRSSPC